MRRSAGQPQRPRTVIQWHDDASTTRVRNLLSDDAPPYRALLLAAALGVLSITAVVSVIQYQRHEGASHVPPVVEEARADDAGGPQPGSGTVVETEAPEMVQVTETELPARAKAPGQDPAAEPQASAAVPAKDEGGRQVAAIQEDEKDSRVVIREKPRQEETVAAPQAPAPASSEEGTGDVALGYAEETTTPSEAPIPEAASRAEQETTAAISQPDNPAATSEGRKEDKKRVRGLTSRVRSAVFLRARPADGSAILTTIPGGAQVAVAPNCRSWCAVSYAGKSGFIYKGFLAR